MTKNKTTSAAASKRRSIGAQRNPESAAAILQAAEAVLAESGYRGFSIEKVAKRAQAGKPTIYRWWPNKAALLLDIYRHQKVIERPDTGDLAEDISRFIMAVFQSWRETVTGEIFRSLIAEAQSNADASAVLSDYAASRRVSFAEIITRAQDRGEVSRDIDPTVTADWVASWLWIHLLTGRLDDTLEQTRAAVRQLIDGVCQPDSAP